MVHRSNSRTRLTALSTGPHGRFSQRDCLATGATTASCRAVGSWPVMEPAGAGPTGKRGRAGSVRNMNEAVFGATARGWRFGSRGGWAEGPAVHPARANGLGGQWDKTAAPGPTGQWFSKGERAARWADNAPWRPRLRRAVPSWLYTGRCGAQWVIRRTICTGKPEVVCPGGARRL